MRRRGSGILLHITSLPSPFGIGDLGPSAYEFADFLTRTKQSYWQLLPLNPTEIEHHNSPYHSTSAFALNPLLISPVFLLKDGLLLQEDIHDAPAFPPAHVAYGEVVLYKEKLFDRAYARFSEQGGDTEYQRFCWENKHWLDDFAFFTALRGHFPGIPWCDWPPEVRDRQPEALRSIEADLAAQVGRAKFLQYVTNKQWKALKDFCNEKGIHIIGDIPIYVQYDSVDLWVHPQFFKLDQQRKPTVVAGVPPDYFSETGQLWGNPLYRWDLLKERGFSWWVQRVERNLELFDIARVDHFRGLVAYWEIPAGEYTATKGKWIQAPVEELFHAIFKKYPYAPLIAEDLGVITPDVREIMHRFGLPGMKLLLFAFGDDLATNPYIPHNVVENCVIFTGTHDNNTARGWFEKEAGPETRERLFRYLGRKLAAEEVPWELVRLAMMSVANTAIFPLQDLLGLGEEARMNRPARAEGNWRWRLLPVQLASDVEKKLLEMTEIYGRS